jgi:hypothetical protein
MGQRAKVKVKVKVKNFCAIAASKMKDEGSKG